MTVRELILLLQKEDQDMKVVVPDDMGPVEVSSLTKTLLY